MSGSIRTALADMMLDEQGPIIEVRFRPGVHLDISGLLEIQRRRHEVTTERCGMMAIFPKNMTSEMGVMSRDYYRETNAGDQLLGLAIVVDDGMSEMMSGLYYSYYPQPFEVRVFTNEPEARTWLLERCPTREGRTSVT